MLATILMWIGALGAGILVTMAILGWLLNKISSLDAYVWSASLGAGLISWIGVGHIQQNILHNNPSTLWLWAVFYIICWIFDVVGLVLLVLFINDD